MPITVEEVAKALDGCQYRQEGSKELFKTCEESHIVVVFGASDDLVELRGAIDDETDPGKVYLDIERKDLLRNSCESEECPHFNESKKTADYLTATFGEDDKFSWKITAEFDHETFIVWEDDEKFCQGIVFKLQS